MALRAPDVRVLAITTVAGNVPVAQATANALYVAELCHSAVPVYIGFDRPLRREYEDATWFHGRDGLGDRGYKAARRVHEKEHAVEGIISTVTENDDVVLVTLGPLTNVAEAVTRAPHIVRRVSRCVVMGGNPCCEGNVTPAAEYNFWVDPDAARIVMRSGLPIELVGWHLCRYEAVLCESEICEIMALQNEFAEFAVNCNEIAKEAYFTQTREIGICLPDAVAMAIALDPSVCSSCTDHYVEVETDSDLTRGITVVDRLGVSADARNRTVWRGVLGQRQARVCWEIDIPKWKSTLYRHLSSAV
jgi:purine nucleosidase